MGLKERLKSSERWSECVSETRSSRAESRRRRPSIFDTSGLPDLHLQIAGSKDENE